MAFAVGLATMRSDKGSDRVTDVAKLQSGTISLFETVHTDLSAPEKIGPWQDACVD